MVKVYTPEKQYSGLSAGVTFVNGVGETDDANVLDWFREHGYSVGDVPAKEPDPETDVDKMTVPELKDHAAKAGIDLGEATKKEEILATIKAAQPTPDK